MQQPAAGFAFHSLISNFSPCHAALRLSPAPLALSLCLCQARGINLSCVRTCVVVAEERPRVALTHSFSKLFKDIGLSPRAVSTTFGSRVNVAICLQVPKCPLLLPLPTGAWPGGSLPTSSPPTQLCFSRGFHFTLLLPSGNIWA